MVIKNKFILVFDLDDTLYNEKDFLISAYDEIAVFLSSKTDKLPEAILSEMLHYYDKEYNVFDRIINDFSINSVTIDTLLSMYRTHKPKIKLSKSTRSALKFVKYNAFKVGLITDGRSIQQRNKIEALGLTDFFDDIIISEEFGSEKPNINNFKFYSDKYGDAYQYFYVGDNIIKDFIAPNVLGWSTICLLDNGNNIHEQNFNLKLVMQPIYLVSSLNKIVDILKKNHHG